MKTHTSQYKENIKTLGRELNSKITYKLNGATQTLTSENLNSVTPSFQGSILKSVMKELEIDSNVDIPVGTVLNYQFGVKVDDEYEYLDFGNYIVYSSEKQEDYNSYKIICYDKMLYSMKDYEKMEIEYPITIKNYINAICEKIGLEFKNKNDEFANSTKSILNELYLDENENKIGYSFRDVLDELAQVTASTICLDMDDKLEIRYVSNNDVDTIDEEFFNDTNVNFGLKYGPINSIVLSRSAESDNVYLQDEESVEQNGLCEIKIKDNQIMNFNNRSDYLNDILEKLNGLEFYLNDMSSKGITYLELCDRYNVNIFNTTYSCVMFNDELLVTQGLEENINTETPNESETDYSKSDKTDKKINGISLIVDKQKNEIVALANTVEQGFNNTYTKSQTEKLIIDATEGITNTFTQTGGSNLIKDSLGALNDGTWVEKIASIKDTYTLENSVAGQGIMLNGETIKQTIQVPNKVHTISFKYKRTVVNAITTVKINDVSYALTSNNLTEFMQTINVSNNIITIEFTSDTDNSCYILDLMLNLGEEKRVWEQNNNEAITDTVKIGKGIQVESSVTNTYWRADSDGSRVVNKTSGKVVSEYTDKGTVTEEFESKSTSKVNGVLFTRMGKHRWISGV